MRKGVPLMLVALALLTPPGPVSGAQVAENSRKVNYLEAGSIVDYTPVQRGFLTDEEELRIFCYSGSEKSLQFLFESVELQLDIEGDAYTQYEGATPAEVREHHDEERSLFSFSLFSQKRTRLQLSPFKQQCIGIKTATAYRIRLQRARVDFLRVIQLAIGVLLFVYAGSLSHNSVFYYMTGIALGICSSFMLLIWLSSKLVPRRTMMYGVLIGGWTIGLYVVQVLWENLQLIVVTYRTYVFWYIVITGLVSFFFCYRWGPPKNQRSKNIIKWVLQFVSLLTIYYSSLFEEATCGIMIITIACYYFPRSVWKRARFWYLRHFPPRQRLLTSGEYYEQGVRETTKALDDLRTFCHSPECKQWQVMTRLRDPLRFADFVEGASHLRDEEILHLESFGEDNESGDSMEEDMRASSSGLNYTQRMELHRMQNSQPVRHHEDMSGDDDSDEDDEDDSMVNAANNAYAASPPSMLQNRAGRVGVRPPLGNAFRQSPPNAVYSGAARMTRFNSHLH